MFLNDWLHFLGLYFDFVFKVSLKSKGICYGLLEEITMLCYGREVVAWAAKMGIKAQLNYCEAMCFQVFFIRNRRERFRCSEFLFNLNLIYPELCGILSFKYKVGFTSLGWEIY